ncbi:MAG TPA: choice-of-anchor Q domain-containing protein [Rhodanobacteraceae bacterium]|nr:choice-of-anchor Q domain-containing protein [Rhodanobacteraceae bacterium]
MHFARPTTARLSGRLPLAAGVLLAFAATIGAATPHAPAGAIVVGNCDDAGAGSLRDAIASAPSGATIDLTSLGCSTISLTTGFLAVAQDDLTLTGPGASALTIDAANASGAIRHAGAGTLSISGLTLANARYESATTPRGGCLYSAANLSVASSTITGCAVVGTASEVARGGGVYAHGDLALANSLVTLSHAQGMVVGGGARGGGVFVGGTFDAEYSTISYNLAYGAPINSGIAGGAMIVGPALIRGTTIFYNGAYEIGGLYTLDDVTLDSSTIYNNGASHTAGMRAYYYTGSPTATIVNSTIAGNRSVATVGGLNLIVAATISNSTIANNVAFNGFAGILMSGPTLDLESTIIAGNIGFNVPDDLDVFGSPVITGASNLVVASSAPLPPDTLGDDPLLGTIGDYGGLTWTIPLLDGSPAIDHGNNIAQLATDQRGSGFARDVGGGPDIGAFEVQGSDVIFRNGFDP